MWCSEFRPRRFLGLALLAAAGLGGCGWDGGGGGTSEAAAVKPNAPTLPYAGKVLVLSGGSNTAHLVLDLSTGQSAYLPQSRYDLNDIGRDGWGAAFDGQELIRTDEFGEVSLFAWPSLQELARFRPKVAEGERLQIGAIRMSRDRQLLAASLASEDTLKSRLRVFDRQGNVLANGPEVRLSSTPSYDWMPDGRLVFLEGEQLFFYDVRKNQISSVELRFPAPTETGYEGLTVSPDGSKIALTRYTLFQRAGGVRRHAVIYVFTPDGGLGRALTEPAPGTLDSANGLRFGQPTWDPQGNYVAFSVSMTGNTGSTFVFSGCPGISVASATASQPTPVDGAKDYDPSTLKFMRDGRPDGRLHTCSSFRWW